MFGEVVFELDVELDEAVHGYRDAAGFEYHDLLYVSRPALWFPKLKKKR